MARLFGCLALAVGFASGVAQGQSREALVEAARAFDESALRLGDDNAKPASIRIWQEPMKLDFDNPGAPPTWST